MQEDLSRTLHSGGIIGAIGNIFSINYVVQNLIILIAAILMLLMSLSIKTNLRRKII